MTTWTSHELNRVAAADELEMAPLRRDGALRKPVPVWVVRDGDDLYARSFRGADGAWWRTASATHQGHIRCGGVDKDVDFVEVTDDEINDRVDTAYRTKYGRYGGAYVDPMVAARSTPHVAGRQVADERQRPCGRTHRSRHPAQVGRGGTPADARLGFLEAVRIGRQVEVPTP